MHRPPRIRHKTLVTFISLMISVILTHQYLRNGRINQFTALGDTKHTPCAIWPDSLASIPRMHPYESCDSVISTPHVGDIKVLGDPKKCLPASFRLDQYRHSSKRNWSEVKWGEIQRQCASGTEEPPQHDKRVEQQWRLPLETHQTHQEGGKTAIVLRTWDNYEYTENRSAWLRALIAEASLQRDGKYRVFFLVNIKDGNARLEEDASVYDEMMRKHVPSEFRDMALLFNERTLESWYPKVPQHSAQDQMYQALQIFSHKFPEYEYIWQLEMDLRFTSHVHDTLTSAATFARAQPRRNLWERNGRFFIPGLYGTTTTTTTNNNNNASYAAISEAVDHEIGDTGIWGSLPTRDFQAYDATPPHPPAPPRSQQSWGVDEESDLISFSPMLDPIGTNWVYESAIHGFAAGASTPRRLAIVSVTRSSRRLLRLVSAAQRERGMWLVSEATLETFALLHGLKAVSVPHPIVFDFDGYGHDDGERNKDEKRRRMTPEELDKMIHKGPPGNRAGGESPSLLYTTHGWVEGPWRESSYWFTGTGAQGVWDAYVRAGKKLPAMLLHPVKEK